MEAKQDTFANLLPIGESLSGWFVPFRMVSTIHPEPLFTKFEIVDKGTDGWVGVMGGSGLGDRRLDSRPEGECLSGWFVLFRMVPAHPEGNPGVKR